MNDSSVSNPTILKFSSYQKFVVGILTFLQFSIVLDFMIISPLGAIVMPALHIGPQQFGLIVSAYAFSAGISGLLAAGFADRFDRKKLLLFFYVGFILGTALCGVAADFQLLLLARIVTGVFGGVIGSVILAIATDLFPLEMRGRVMGFLQTAFAASQILGIPVGLYLANWWNWHAPFLMIVLVGAIAGFVIVFAMRPVDMHLMVKQKDNPLTHLLRTVAEPKYLLAFVTTGLLSIGGYMMMPLSSAFIVDNLQIDIARLPMIFLATGICTIFAGPLIGKASDRFGKFRIFLFGTIVSIAMVLTYSNMGPSSLLMVVIVNAVMMVGVFSRMIPSQALMTAIPEVTTRGAFNAVSASLQQVSGGIASVIGGLIVVQNADGQLAHFDIIGDLVAGTAVVALALMYRIHLSIPEKTQKDGSANLG